MIWSPLIRWEAIHRSQFFLFCKQSLCLAFLHMWYVYISKHFFKSLFVSFVNGFFVIVLYFSVIFENKAWALSNFNMIKNYLSAWTYKFNKKFVQTQFVHLDVQRLSNIYIHRTQYNNIYYSPFKQRVIFGLHVVYVNNLARNWRRM